MELRGPEDEDVSNFGYTFGRIVGFNLFVGLVYNEEKYYRCV